MMHYHQSNVWVPNWSISKRNTHYALLLPHIYAKRIHSRDGSKRFEVTSLCGATPLKGDVGSLRRKRDGAAREGRLARRRWRWGSVGVSPPQWKRLGWSYLLPPAMALTMLREVMAVGAVDRVCEGCCSSVFAICSSKWISPALYLASSELSQ